MIPRAHKLCVWSAPVMTVGWLVGFGILAGCVPPPDPTDTPAQVAAWLAENRNSMRLGLLITCMASPLLMPFFSAVSVQMRRIEGRHSPMAYTQMVLGGLLVLEFLMPLFFLQAALFRDDRSPEIISTLNDITWLLFVGAVSTNALQTFIMGVTILLDRRETPIYPRWAGYMNVWIGTLFCTGGVCVFFKTGPFAWNGLFPWWQAAVLFCIWIGAMTYLTLKAIDRQVAEEGVGFEHPQGAGRPDARIDALDGEVEELKAQLKRLTAGAS